VETIEGRTALVTGGASGIGLGIVEALVDAGARVVIADRDAGPLEREAERLAGRVIGQLLDVADRAGWHEAKRNAEAVFGPVDILVNNAGIAPDFNELADMPLEHFDRAIGIMLVGVFNGIHTFGPGMRERRHGHILNTASMNGLVSVARTGAYTAAKFGVVGMTEALRKEMDPYGVGVSVLCPGAVRSNLLRDASPDEQIVRSHRGIDPRVVGDQVVGAIRRNELYVITHGQHKPGVEARLAALVDAFDRAPIAEPAAPA
jgi:NAD(P)-dependent dehydrogenase (short-subunit alcohol dehydrogenase family)